MFAELPNLIANAETVSYIGKIENIVGMAMEASGNRASIGDIAMIYNEDKKRQIPVEVVGFKDGRSQLMAYENMSGISQDTGGRVPSGPYHRRSGKSHG